MATKDSGGQDRAAKRTEETAAVTEEATIDVQERVGKLPDDVDAPLAEIDETLESNAEDVGAGFIPKGGQ